MEKVFKEGVTVKNFTTFVSPSVIMIMFMSLYYIIDAIFVANFVGENALAAMNIVYPICGIGWGIAVMLASGSSAIVAIKMGENKLQEANEKFSLICVTSAVLAVVFVVLGIVFTNQLVSALGATDLLMEYCLDYARVIILGIPAVFLGTILEYFIRTDGRPGFTLFLYLLGGIVNIVLDYVFIAVLGFGVAGAAWATISGQYVVVIVGIIYFITQKTNLKFSFPKLDLKYIGHSMINGSSEMVSESSVAITIILFNYIALNLAGETGVAALAVVLDAHYLLISMHLGFITGVAPLISYYFGAKEFGIVNKCLKYSRNFILFSSVTLTILSFFGASVIAGAFLESGTESYIMAVRGIKFIAIAFMFTGINVFASGFFTAYANGLVSAAISFSRGFVFVVVGAIALPYAMGIDGVWLTPAFAEIITLCLTFIMLKKYKERYQYSFK